MIVLILVDKCLSLQSPKRWRTRTSPLHLAEEPTLLKRLCSIRLSLICLPMLAVNPGQASCIVTCHLRILRAQRRLLALADRPSEYGIHRTSPWNRVGFGILAVPAGLWGKLASISCGYIIRLSRTPCCRRHNVPNFTIWAGRYYATSRAAAKRDVSMPVTGRQVTGMSWSAISTKSFGCIHPYNFTIMTLVVM